MIGFGLSRRASVLALMLVLGGSGAAGAATFTVDENGNGTGTSDFGVFFSFAGGLESDPGPGGRNNVLTYNVGIPGLVAGDVLITENGAISDLVRFNSGRAPPPSLCYRYGCLFFYSANLAGIDSIADAAGLPGAFEANAVTIPEIGGAATYTPAPGQPGSTELVDRTYNLISDIAVPEPASLAILSAGLAGLAFAGNRRRRRASGAARGYSAGLKGRSARSKKAKGSHALSGHR